MVLLLSLMACFDRKVCYPIEVDCEHTQCQGCCQEGGDCWIQCDDNWRMTASSPLKDEEVEIFKSHCYYGK